MKTEFPKVAMLAPISWRTPPRHYGPWELVVSLITEGLVARGVDVTLFATADSLTRAKLAAVCPRPCSEDASLDSKVWESLHISHLFERAAEFDLIHNHFDFLPLCYSALVKTPVLTTQHGFSNERILPVYKKYDGRSHYVSISLADRHPELNYIANVYHGIDMDQFRVAPEKSDYLLFWGRIHPDKGTAEAIELARRANRRLLIAGIIHDNDYFAREVEPHIDDDRVQYLGAVGPDRRAEILGRARALIHLINFNEPFGLSVVEAMACGTPVIASPRGSMPEIIEPGVNGALVGNPDEAGRAVGEVAALDPVSIRKSVVARFGRERMVDDYLRVYKKLLKLHHLK
ncbi:MAG: glycosyltransferase family 4 protein [Opitutales bacterium]